MNLIDLALAVLALTYLGAIIRLVRGPSDADRVVAADLAFFVLIAGVALLAVRLDEPSFLDVTIVATLVGFLASIALAGLLDRRRPRRRR